MIRYLAACLCIFISCSVINASDQAGIITGKVIDRNTRAPLEGVYIVYGMNLGTTTGPDGSYFIRTAEHKLSLTFRFIGYETLTREVIFRNSSSLEINAELEMKISEIDQIVVSANKNEQKVAELSVSMDIIKEAFLKDNHINDAQELVNKTSGIEVMDGQASVRGGSGFSYGAGSRVLALIDGMPVISADAGNIRWQFLPLENLEQVEIIKGASSVLYGSSALNGVINFRTADATNTPETNFFVETGIFDKPRNKNWIWWDSPRIFASVSLAHMQKTGNNGIGIAFNLLDDEGYRWLNAEKLGRISLKLKHYSSKVEGLTYGLNINSGLTVKRDFVLWENAETGALKQQENATIELHGDYLSVDPFVTLKKSDRYRHDLRMRYQLLRNRFPESEKNNSDAATLFTEYQLWYKLSEMFNITAGTALIFNNITSAFYGNHRGMNIAGYTQVEMNPVKRLKAVAGLRIEQNSLDGINDKMVPVLRAGLNWQAAGYTFLRASFGQGYRYPSVAEKYASTTLGSVTIFPNEDILPESGWSTEAGIKQGVRFGKIQGQADLSVFMSQNKDMIEYFLAIYTDPVTGISSTGFKATNIEHSRVYGTELELMLNGSIGKVNTSVTGGYTYIYPIEYNINTGQNTDFWLKYRRKHSGKIGFTAIWKKVETGLTVYARSKILRIDEFFLNEVTGEAILPGFPDYWKTHNTGYITMDANLGYKINNSLKLSLAVKNITNTEYMGRPGDIQPQRNFSLRFSGNF